MLISLAAECTATYSLSKYENLQSHIETMSGGAAHLYNNNIIDAAIVTIVFCVLVATVFGADFFFLLFWPQRRYPRWYDVTKLLVAVVITLGMAAAALMSTIVIARQSIQITGVDSATVQQYTNIYHRPPAVYRHFSTNIAWVVLIWPAFLSTIASTYIMFFAYSHSTATSPQPTIEKDVEALPIRGQEPQDDARVGTTA
ncbi:hypothetical protein BJ912DRAFT_196138 [Pholiota molesta]|nr:hypothetical protein BJ912DRAFT_196138 [Pholiota molesta]